MGFQFVPISVILNDSELHNGRYFALFHWIWWIGGGGGSYIND